MTAPTDVRESTHKEPGVDVEQAFIHQDLVDLCDYADPEMWSDSEFDREQLCEIVTNVRCMFESGVQPDRLAAAQQVLEKLPRSGLPYVILAREGGQGGAETEAYYEKTVQLLREECTRLEQLCEIEPEEEADAALSREPYMLLSCIWEHIVAEQCRFLWRQNKHDQAIRRGIELLAELDRFDAEMSPFVMSWLIQSGRDEEAASLLGRHPSTEFEWHYMNALMLFRREGNTAISRAALQEALLEDVPYGRQLLLEAAQPQYFWQVADSAEVQPAWNLSHGAIDWLRANIDVRPPPIDHRSLTSEADAETADRARFRRWKDTFERAQRFVALKDWKEAKRLLKTALREADKFGPASEVLGKTTQALASMFEKTGANSDEIAELTCRKAAYYRALWESEPNPSILFALWHLSMSYFDDGAHQEAAELLTWVNPRLESLLSEGNDSVDALDAEQFVFQLGRCLQFTSQYADAESCYRRALEWQESYLGDKHPQLLPNLFAISRCLHFQGKDSDADVVRARIAQLQPDRFDELASLLGDDDEFEDDESDGDELIGGETGTDLAHCCSCGKPAHVHSGD